MSVPPSAPFALQGLDHIVLRTGQVEVMIDFYATVLGATLERQLPDEGLYQLRAGASLIDLVDVAKPLGKRGGAPAGPQGRNLEHCCLRITPWREQALRQHLARHGVACSSTERRYGAEGFGPSLYLQDPDGNVIDLKGALNTGPQPPGSSPQAAGKDA